MLVNFLVNSGCKMFSAKIFLLAGWLGTYSPLVFSNKDIISLESLIVSSPRGRKL